jgi:hypothetical protein
MGERAPSVIVDAGNWLSDIRLRHIQEYEGAPLLARQVQFDPFCSVARLRGDNTYA